MSDGRSEIAAGTYFKNKSKKMINLTAKAAMDIASKINEAKIEVKFETIMSRIAVKSHAGEFSLDYVNEKFPDDIRDRLSDLGYDLIDLNPKVNDPKKKMTRISWDLS